MCDDEGRITWLVVIGGVKVETGEDWASKFTVRAYDEQEALEKATPTHFGGLHWAVLVPQRMTSEFQLKASAPQRKKVQRDVA